MRKGILLLILLSLMLSTTSVGCISWFLPHKIHHHQQETLSRTFEGVLEGFSAEDETITIDGRVYRIAEGMKSFFEFAQVGRTYEFTIDEHGSIIRVIPVE